MFNNRKAPRFNPRKFRVNVVSEELYEKWKAETGYDITFQQFKEYWNSIGEAMTEAVITEKDGIRLGAGLGDIYVGYVPGMKAKPIDYKTSAEFNKQIKFENWENGGKVGKIIYATKRRKYIYRMHGWWAFKACREFKSKVSHALRTRPQDFKNSIEKRTL